MMAANAILDCRIGKILLADGVWRAQTRHCTKFRQNRSFRCADIAIFWFFKMAAVRHFGFVWGIFGPPTVSTWGLYHSAKFGYDRCSSFIYNMYISIFGAFGWKRGTFSAEGTAPPRREGVEKWNGKAVSPPSWLEVLRDRCTLIQWSPVFSAQGPRILFS